VPAFMALCAPGFRQKTANAVIDREQLYEQLREMCEAVDNYKQETHIEGLRITAKEARVVTTEICAFTQTDAASELIVHHYRQAMHNRDIWVYIGKRWLLKYMETTVEN